MYHLSRTHYIIVIVLSSLYCVCIYMYIYCVNKCKYMCVLTYIYNLLILIRYNQGFYFFIQLLNCCYQLGTALEAGFITLSLTQSQGEDLNFRGLIKEPKVYPFSGTQNKYNMKWETSSHHYVANLQHVFLSQKKQTGEKYLQHL